MAVPVLRGVLVSRICPSDRWTVDGGRTRNIPDFVGLADFCTLYLSRLPFLRYARLRRKPDRKRIAVVNAQRSRDKNGLFASVVRGKGADLNTEGLQVETSNYRFGADVDRYFFIMTDLHNLLLAGLPARLILATSAQQ